LNCAEAAYTGSLARSDWLSNGNNSFSSWPGVQRERRAAIGLQ